MKILAGLIAAIGVIALIAGIVLLFTFPIMWAINWVFTPALLTFVFGVSKLTFWKTFVFAWVISTLTKGTSSSSSK